MDSESENEQGKERAKEEVNNMKEVQEFVFFKKGKVKREHIELVKSNIEDILNGDNEGLFGLLNLLFFMKDANYVKNNLCICLHQLSRALNEINVEDVKKKVFKYIVKKLECGKYSYFDRALFCKKFLSFCSAYEDISSELRNVECFHDLFVNCLSFLDSLFYSNDKLSELSHKFRMVKKGAIKKLMVIFSNICNINKNEKGEKKEWKKATDMMGGEELDYILNMYAKEKYFFYLIVESFGLFLCKNSEKNILDRKKYVDRFTNNFINLLNSNKEILLKINRSFKYIFQNGKDDKIFQSILNHIHRYDEVALINSSPFYYYCEIYTKEHFYTLLEIIINMKKNKDVKNCNILYFILFYKFHINNENDSVLKMLIERNEKLNIVKFDEKITFLKTATYLLSTNRSKEIKDIVLANRNMITNYLKKDLNEDVKLECLIFLRNFGSILKNDKDVYKTFSPLVLEILEKYGKNNDKFLHYCLLFFIDLVDSIEVNEKLISTFKAHLNFCLTKQILKYIYGTNLFLLLYIKNKHSSSGVTINNHINEILLKSLYNQSELFYLYDIIELKKIPPNKFFFYVYSFVLLLHFLLQEDKKTLSDYVNEMMKDFPTFIYFDQLAKSHVLPVLLGEKNTKAEEEKKKKAPAIALHESKKELMKKDNPKNKRDHMHMLMLMTVLCLLHYLEGKKFDKNEYRKKNEKKFHTYLLSLKRGGIINEENCEYQSYVDDFDMLLDILLMQKEVYQVLLHSFYVYLYLYWNSGPRFRYDNGYVLRRFVFILLSYMDKIELEPTEKNSCYFLLLLCLCHPCIFYKNLRSSVSRRRMKKYICGRILSHVNLDTVIAFILKGSDYYNNELHKSVCLHLIEVFYIWEISPSWEKRHVTEGGEVEEENVSILTNRTDSAIVGDTLDKEKGKKKYKRVKFAFGDESNCEKNYSEMMNGDDGRNLVRLHDHEVKRKLTDFTSKLIDMLDDSSIQNVKEEEIEICKCPFNSLYVDKNVYQPTVVVESKNVKRNKHLFSMYDEETAEMIMKEELNKSKKTTANSSTSPTKDKKGNKSKELTKEDLEMEEIKKQNEIRIKVQGIVERNKYILQCIKKMSYIDDIYDTKYINLFIKKIMAFLKNDLTSRYSQAYLNKIIQNMISTKLLTCKNKITRCLYKISKYNKADESAIIIFSSFNMNQKISYVLTLFLFPIVLHSINIINDKDATLNIMKTLEILLHSKTKINDEDALKCLQISFEKYPDLDIELESFLDNFNSYLLSEKNVKALLELCVTDNEKRRNVIIKSLYKFVKNEDIKGDKDSLDTIFKSEFIHLHMNIFLNDYNEETQECCEEIIRTLGIAPVSDQYKLIDLLQKECSDFQNMICKAIVGSTDRKKTKELLLQLTSKYITFKEYGKIGILKTMEELAKEYYVILIDDVEFILNFLLGLCLEEKKDISKIKEFVITCGSSVINLYNEYLIKSKRKATKKKANRKGPKSGTSKNGKGKKKFSSGKHQLEESEEESYSEEDEDFKYYSSDGSASSTEVSKRGNSKKENKELEEAFQRIYKVLNKYRDNKKSNNKSVVDLVVVMFYGCLGANLKKESLELLNKLIEQILHKDTDNFTQIEISGIIPKFIENLKSDKEDFDDEYEEEELEEFDQMNPNMAKSVTSRMSNSNKKKTVTFYIDGKLHSSPKGAKGGGGTVAMADDKKGGNVVAPGEGKENESETQPAGGKKGKKKNKGDKGNNKGSSSSSNTLTCSAQTDGLIYLENYDVGILVEKIFSIVQSHKDLKVRKGCCLLLGSVVKAHGMHILKRFNILGKVNCNIYSEDIIKRQSFYLMYGYLFKVLKIKFEPYILKNFKLLLECYKDNVNNIKVLGVSVIEEILNVLGQYGLKKILPFIIFSLKNSSIRNKDVVSYLDTLHLIICKFDIICYVDNPTLVNLVNLLCELVSETNSKVREICIRIFNKLEKMIQNVEMKNISRQLLLCIYSPNDNHLCDFLDIFSAISFQYKIDNISLCLLFPVIKKGINNIRLDLKKKALQILYFLIYLVNDQSLFIIYYDSIFKILIVLLNDAIPEIRFLTAKSVGNICYFLDMNKKLYYIQYIFNILINTESSVEKSGVSLCLSSILAKCSETIAENFISTVVRLIDVKKYIEMKNRHGKRAKQIEDKVIKGGRKGGSGKGSKSVAKGKVAIEFSSEGEEDDDDEDGVQFVDSDMEEGAYSTGEAEEDYDDDEDDEDDDDDEEEDDDEEGDHEDQSSGDEIYTLSDESEDEDFEADEEGTSSKGGRYYEEEEEDDDDDDDDETEEEDDSLTEEESDSDDDVLSKNSEKKSTYLNGLYLIEKNEDNDYRIQIDDDLANWNLVYDKKIIKNDNSKEGLIGFFIYIPECAPRYTEKFLKKILQKLLLCLNDTSEKIRDIALRSCKVLISIFSRDNTSLILKFIENKIYNSYWRIRKDTVLLLNVLIEKNIEINKEEKDIETLNLLHERFYFMLSLICIMRNDKNINVRQTAYSIYKNYVNKRILQEMWPILLKKITQNLSSRSTSKQIISASALSDLVFKTDSNNLESILENMVNEFKTTKCTSIRKGISLGFCEIFSQNKYHNFVVTHVHNIIYMIKELANQKNTGDLIKSLSLLLKNIDQVVLKGIINDFVTDVMIASENRNSLKKFTSKQYISFKSIKIFLNVHTELVIDIIVDKALVPPYSAAKMKLLSYVSYAKLSNYTVLFRKLMHIFINLILGGLREFRSHGFDMKNYSAVVSYSMDDNAQEGGVNEVVSKEELKMGKSDEEEEVDDEEEEDDDEDDDEDEEDEEEDNGAFQTDMKIQDIIISLKSFLKNISDRNVDTLTEILFAELRKNDGEADLSYGGLEKLEDEEKRPNGNKAQGQSTDLSCMHNYAKICSAGKLAELKKFESTKRSGKVREIILSIFKYMLDIINEGDICVLNNECLAAHSSNATEPSSSRNKGKIQRKKRVHILHSDRIITYLSKISKYALIDINKKVLEIGSIIYMYLIELIKMLDSNYCYVETVQDVINKYSSDSNLAQVPDGKYEIVGLNMNKKLFASLVGMCTHVILMSTNPNVKIKAIDIVRMIFLYTNKEVSSPQILKVSGILIRVLTNKYIEQAKIYIFSTFEVLIRKGSNFIRPLIPQLQTCIIKSLSNEKLKNQIIHILNIISEKKLSRVDLLINDLLNNINIQTNPQQSITIFMILSNILSSPDVNIKNILNKIINSVKSNLVHSNLNISFYACKIYVLLIFFHLPNKKQYLESILVPEKERVDFSTYYFVLHISEISNFYDILKRENMMECFKQVYENILKDEINSLQNVSYQIFYNMSKQDEECISFVYGLLPYLKLPPMTVISVEIHRYYFKGLRNIFKKYPGIYKENEPIFLLILDNLQLALSNTVQVFKSLGERCAKHVLEINDEPQHKAKMNFLKDHMEGTKYNLLLEQVNRLLAKKHNIKSDSE
ncbi:conserved Plasmodium protein, unknown function [Plasmodium knowlesi strain H]|uniref:Translational activator GCN1 n=3 Tax=Plasmodium knowlesi TaxID=5850 RepID=A0A5K1V9R5_PLAKH|nr:translational activator GCN1, putative [Plasmodium knowlesi strain H]OTN64006.1 Uncharacterized protein PKNOH_S140222600 [Plasmodium knowlesi]CAA9990654.1 translational activator GCN1, putative [Plasmodium knowlesi strain H]SBO25979.1 conserved Plasmodium protein, unknown function [Plasmodium knowlesi strain H]SBO28704.1 conserved Plasmodium protein, unknown function [Plasmodium knowlesi strain H]VVS80128.1 translational activator GCN1, putative [Plasmodium knowlesi strain H]|eukprot:XP_002261945.1 hypothetical protein, conserved in Plasmodium species [Plasmodium knowlesi strain H]